jgi:SWIM/SEC-C metal-binding protein
MEKRFDGKKTPRLGTEKKPANVTVQTEERSKELSAVFEKNGWTCNITVDADVPEDINDLEILLNPIKTSIAEEKIGRNDPCPCGSGKKYKKCCGK